MRPEEIALRMHAVTKIDAPQASQIIDRLIAEGGNISRQRSTGWSSRAIKWCDTVSQRFPNSWRISMTRRYY